MGRFGHVLGLESRGEIERSKEWTGFPVVSGRIWCWLQSLGSAGTPLLGPTGAGLWCGARAGAESRPFRVVALLLGAGRLASLPCGLGGCCSLWWVGCCPYALGHGAESFRAVPSLTWYASIHNFFIGCRFILLKPLDFWLLNPRFISVETSHPLPGWVDLWGIASCVQSLSLMDTMGKPSS